MSKAAGPGDPIEDWWVKKYTARQVRDALDKLVSRARHGDLVLGCYCSPLPCHGDGLKAYIEWRLTND